MAAIKDFDIKDLAGPLTLLGTLMEAIGLRDTGDEADQAASLEAQQLRQKAGQERASSQREAMEGRRAGRLRASRATALAAAGGGGLSTGDVNLISKLEGAGEYAALAALYEGESSARGLEYAAAVRGHEGRRQREKYRTRALGKLASGAQTLLATGVSLREKYG